MEALNEKVAIVTGASSGIGRAIALALAGEGIKIALAARRQEALEKLAAEIKENGGEALVVPTDVKQEAQLKNLVEQTKAHFGQLDILINNAGIFHRRLVEDITEAELLETLQVNLMAPFLLTKHALPHLKKQKEAAIINMASIAATMSFVSGGSYCASKHGLLGFSEALFEEVRGNGIKVCAICPGFVKTDMVTGRGLNEEKMIPAEDIGQLIVDFLKLSPNTAPTRLIVRPQFSVY